MFELLGGDAGGFQLQATWLLSELRGAARGAERRCFDPNQLQRKRY
jgi:hypothetical protein